MDKSSSQLVRLGARGSLLSRMQSQGIVDALKLRHPGVAIEMVLIETSGDQIKDRPLHEAGGKGLFTKEIEQALLAGRVDIAVHSYKDVPVTMPLVDQAELVIAAVPVREDPRDVLVCTGAKRIADLPMGARVGTGSLRRKCQILARRPDLRVELVRGNIDTRLRKVRAGEFDAILLALAGVKRAGLFNAREMTAVEFDEMIPAAGQGALALQCRREDARARELLGGLHSAGDAMCVDLEREVVRRLEGDCHSPIGALAVMEGEGVWLRVVVGGRGGEGKVIFAEGRAERARLDNLVEEVIKGLNRKGVEELLRGD